MIEREPVVDGRSPTAAGRSLALVQFLVLAGLAEALNAAGTAGRVVGGRLLAACLRAAVRAFGRSVVGGAMDNAIEEVRLAQWREVRAAARRNPVAGRLRRAVEGAAEAGARRLFGIVGQEPVLERARSRGQGR